MLISRRKRERDFGTSNSFDKCLFLASWKLSKHGRWWLSQHYYKTIVIIKLDLSNHCRSITLATEPLMD
jgi:hypothetical protein